MIMWLAPMDGVTDYPYRMIVEKFFSKYGDKNNELRKRTEFMSADGYMINPSRLIKHLIKSPNEKRLIAQIYWWNKDTLIKTAQDIEKKYSGFFGIELNIWCPSPKVLSCGAGAGMMKNKEKTLEYIKNISESLSIPFSIKTRTGLDNNDRENQFNFILQAAKYCKTISIHGRTYKQWHQWEVDRDFIYHIKQEVGNSCRIIGNGGIESYEDTKRHSGHIDGIMIWQAAIQQPWIFTSHIPSKEEKKEIAINHFITMIAYEVYMTKTREQFPEISDQLIINRQHLHLQKKYNPDSDEIIDIPSIDFHDYVFPMPEDNTIEEYKSIITNTIKNQEEYIKIDDFSLSINEIRCGIDFRKYVFGYIKGYENTKITKDQLIQTKDIRIIYNILKNW